MRPPQNSSQIYAYGKGGAFFSFPDLLSFPFLLPLPFCRGEQIFLAKNYGY